MIKATETELRRAAFTYVLLMTLIAAGSISLANDRTQGTVLFVCEHDLELRSLHATPFIA